MTISTVAADGPVWASHYNLIVNAVNRGLLEVHATKAALTAVSITGVTFYKTAVVLDEYLYIYDPNSTDAPNGEDILAPDSGTGNWLGVISLAKGESTLADYLLLENLLLKNRLQTVEGLEHTKTIQFQSINQGYSLSATSGYFMPIETGGLPAGETILPTDAITLNPTFLPPSTALAYGPALNLGGGIVQPIYNPTGSTIQFPAGVWNVSIVRKL